MILKKKRIIIILRNIIKNIIKKLGYDVVKVVSDDDIDLYLRLYNADDVANRRFYNIGAGKFKHLAWTNVDYTNDWYKDNSIAINHDLFSQKMLPISNNSSNIVYSSHTIEHIDDESAQFLFNDTNRILKPGGIFRLSTPDIDLCYRSLLNNDRDFWMPMINAYSNNINMKKFNIITPLSSVSLAQIFLFSFASQLSLITPKVNGNKISDNQLYDIFSNNSYEDSLDYIIGLCDLDIQKQFTVNHINWWNKKKLFKMLNTAGFEKVYLSGYGQSQSPVLRNLNYFDYTTPYLSIYIEAIK
jgi:SAM-dependent methyltransferase